MIVESHADYDRWEALVKARGGAQTVYSLYRESMLRQRGDQRTFVRWIISALDPELDEQYRRSLQPYIQSLMKATDLGLDAHYLFGAIAWFQLRQDPLGANAPRTSLQRKLVRTVQTHWERVIKENPQWRGPHGITSAELQDRINALAATVAPPEEDLGMAPKQQTFGPEIASKVEAAYKAASREPPWQHKAAEAREALQGFYQEYEEHGAKRACQRVDQAMKLVQDPTAVGDAYAHCALDRRNPFSALDQVRRMVLSRRMGGLHLVLSRLSDAARSNDAFATELNELKPLIKRVCAIDPVYANTSGLSEWINREGHN